MKKKLLYLLSAAFICTNSYSQVSYSWVNKTSNIQYADPLTAGMVTELSTSSNNAVYTAGTFAQSLTIGTQTITGSDFDGYIGKYNLSGQIQWLKAIKHVDQKSIYIKGMDYFSNGDILVVGAFSVGTVDFGGGITLSSMNINVPEASDAMTGFIARYSSAGVIMWAKSVDIGITTDAATIECSAVAVDRVNNVAFVVGSGSAFFSDNTISFLGSSTYTMPLLTETGDAYIGKIDALGNPIGFRRIYGNVSYGNVNVKSVKLDASQNPVVFGDFTAPKLLLNATGTIYVTNAKSGTVGDIADLFLVKFNKALNYIPLWSKSFGGINGETAGDLAISSNGDIYAVGTYDRQTKLSYTTMLGLGFNNGFLLKCNSLGSFSYARNLACANLTSRCNPAAVALETINGATNVYIMSNMTGSVKVQGNTTAINSNQQSKDILYTKFSAGGTLAYRKTIGGAGSNSIVAFSVKSGNVGYIWGDYAGSNFTLGSTTLTAVANKTTGFFCKLNTSTMRMGSVSETITASEVLTDYAFTKSTTTYTSLVNPISFQADSANTWQDLAVPFTFNYFGTAYDTVKFSSTRPGGIAWLTESQQDYIFALSADLVSNANGTSSLGYTIDSTTPQAKVLTVEWKDVAFAKDTTRSATVSFQIKFYGESNAIEFVYGPTTGTIDSAYYDNSNPTVLFINQEGDKSFILTGDPTNPTLVFSDTLGNTLNSFPPNGTSYKFTPSAPNVLKKFATTTSVSLYPNPSNGIVYLSGKTEEIKSVEVIDFTGRVVYNMNNVSSRAMLDLSSLSTGVYVVKVYNVNGTFSMNKIELMK